MSVKPAEATSFKKFTTSNIAYKNGTLRVTYTPGKKDASAVKTLQILNSETVTGINAAIADSDAPVEYFNLQGVRVNERSRPDRYPPSGQRSFETSREIRFKNICILFLWGRAVEARPLVFYFRGIL